MSDGTSPYGGPDGDGSGRPPTCAATRGKRQATPCRRTASLTASVRRTPCRRGGAAAGKGVR
ncbi:DUF6380 family protein [Streptomyces sp. B3I8]|uniref:DUF6380 family protein n=1 Tax=unclassified Streptomyces TaxID=2593676 RepID=UPI00358E6A41